MNDDDAPPAADQPDDAPPPRFKPRLVGKDEPPINPAGRVNVRVDPGLRVDAAEKIAKALVDRKKPIYRRAGLTVIVRDYEIPTWDEKVTVIPTIMPARTHTLEPRIAEVARCIKRDGRTKGGGDKVVDLPNEIEQLLLANPDLFPLLAGIVNQPYMRPNGEIVTAEGYDRASRLLVDFRGVEFLSVPDRPSREDALAALELLREPFQTFDFASRTEDKAVGEDEAVALTLVLTLMQRRALRSAPMFGGDAPKARTGKSKLIDTASSMILGHVTPVINQGHTEEEFEKRLNKMLIKGPPLIAIDNCEMPVGGATLCSMLTQQTTDVRVLGRSDGPVVQSNITMVANGNNLTVASDVIERIIKFRLDAKCEYPGERQFDYDPVADALARRPLFVWAALVILRAYAVAGRPRMAMTPFGGFEQWSNQIRAPLIWLGCADPCLTRASLREIDPDVQTRALLFSQWWAHFSDQTMTSSEVIDMANKRQDNKTGEGSVYWDYVFPGLRAALVPVCQLSGRGLDPAKLTRWLGSKRNQPTTVGDKVMTMNWAGSREHAMQWALSVAGDDTPNVVADDDDDDVPFCFPGNPTRHSRPPPAARAGRKSTFFADHSTF